eukprot:4962584-Prorocentrum_lima.AAC.1
MWLLPSPPIGSWRVHGMLLTSPSCYDSMKGVVLGNAGQVGVVVRTASSESSMVTPMENRCGL